MEHTLDAISAHPAFALWLIPHFMSAIVPLLVGYVIIHRGKISLRVALSSLTIYGVLSFVVAPANVFLTRPRPMQFIVEFWVSTSLTTSAATLVASSLATAIVFSAHHGKNG